jgi:hypothetical protein
MAKGLLLVELDLDDDNLKELQENQDKLRRALVDGIWGALSWYGDDKAKVEQMSIRLGSAPKALSKAAAEALKDLSAQDQMHWTLYLMEELDDGGDEADEMLDCVHGSLTRRIWMGRW